MELVIELSVGLRIVIVVNSLMGDLQVGGGITAIGDWEWSGTLKNVLLVLHYIIYQLE